MPTEESELGILQTSKQPCTSECFSSNQYLDIMIVSLHDPDGEGMLPRHCRDSV